MASTQGIILILITVALTAFSLAATFQERKRIALLSILVLAFVLRIFVAGDLYLHDWDERFHANVAKNILAHPFSPLLYDDEVLEYTPNNWAEGKIWLSKPVLAFWPMGASIGAFGANEFGLRFPSLVFGLLGVWLTYLIGRRLFDDQIGLIAAFLHAIHGMLLRFGGGITSSDHIDQLFTLLCAWAVYAYLVYTDLRRKRYLLLCGIVIGLAFMTKWVMAFFPALVIAIIHLFVVKSHKACVKDGALVLLSAVCVATPWVVYLYIHHPVEVKLVFRDFMVRTDEVFEGHSGGPFFYLEQVVKQFRGGVLVPLAWLFIISWKKWSKSNMFLAIWIAIPLLLLSLLSTKRGTYLMMSAPAYFLLTGYFIKQIILPFARSTKRWVAIGACTLLLGLPFQYTLEQVKPFQQRFVLPEWRLDLRRRITWNDRLGEKIIIHDYPHAMDAMFYYDVLAYQRRLQPEEIEKFEILGYRVFSLKMEH